MIYNALLEQRDAARRAQTAGTLQTLTTAIGEVERRLDAAKRTDEGIIQILKKMVNDNKESIKFLAGQPVRKLTLELENEVLEAFLPAQLTEEEIAGIIASNDLTNIKEVMAFMKANYAGQYDGRMVSQLFNK